MKFYHAFVTTFLVIILFILVGLIFWGNNKGLDLTDESLGIIFAQAQQETGIYVTNYHLIVKKILFFEPTIINLRIAFFFCGVLNSSFLAYFLHNWLKQKKAPYQLFKKPIYIYFFIILGSFFAYQHQRTISYDITHTTISMICLCFFLFFIITKIEIQKTLLIILAGFFLSFLFATRITSAFIELFTFITFLIIHLITIPKKREKLSYFLGFFIGIGIGLITYHTKIQTITIFISNTAAISPSVSEWFLAGNHYKSIFEQTFFYLPLALGIIALSAIFLLAIFHFIKNNNYSILLLIKYKKTQVLVLGISCVVTLYTTRFFQHSSIYFIVFVLFMVLFSSIFFNKFSIEFIKQQSINNLIIYILLLMQPLIMVVGTNTSILGKAAYGVACWFVFIYAYLSENHIKIYASLRWQFIALICVHCAICLPYNLVHRLYRTLPLIQQTEYLPNLPNANGIQFDNKTAKMINQIYTILLEHNFKRGDYILTDKNLGLVHLLGGKLPSGFIWNEWAIAMYLYNLQHSSNFEKANFFIILPQKIITKMPIIFDELAKKGIDINKYDKIKINIGADDSKDKEVIFWIYAPPKKQE